MSNILYTNQTIIPSKPLQINPRYASLLSTPTEENVKEIAPSLPQLSSSTTPTQECTKDEVLALFDQWTQSFHRVQKCRMEMQKHRMHLKDAETQLKGKLKKYLDEINNTSISVPFQERQRGVKRGLTNEEEEEQIMFRPAFLTVHEQEKKKAFSAKLLRDLLTKHFGEEKGKEVFTFLNDNRVTDQKISTLKILKGPRNRLVSK